MNRKPGSVVNLRLTLEFCFAKPQRRLNLRRPPSV